MQAREINSRDNALLVRLRKLAQDPGAYRKLGEIWIEGDHLCSAFLRRGGVPAQAVITDTGWNEPALHRLACRAATIAIVPLALMKSVSTLESPAHIGFVVPWQGEVTIRPDEPSVVLDRVQDAGNVGAVLRSAAAFGFTQVLALKGTAALWSPKVLRAGMGAHFALQLVEGLPDAAVDGLGVALLATSSHAEAALNERTLPWPCAWVMGHEGQGVSLGLIERCAQVLRIPQPGGEESLNVAAAAAVCLYESARQRSLST